jgi:cell division GTPase FtsZ
MKRYRSVDNIKLNTVDRFIELVLDSGCIKIPFYEINHVSIFADRISIDYKKASVATLRADEMIIKAKGRELLETRLQVRNAS